jgi:acyl-CoA hydrolase
VASVEVDVGTGGQPGKLVRESQVIMGRQMMPDDTNPWGYVHGGVIMKMVDEAAGSAAIRHSRSRVATAAIDYMRFLHSAHVGDLITVLASVNDVGKTSMEVGVRVETEDMLTGERHHVSSAYVVMVALDEEGTPVKVPPIVAGTSDERRRMAAAKIRRAQRKVLEGKLKDSDALHAEPPPVASDLVTATGA